MSKRLNDLLDDCLEDAKGTKSLTKAFCERHDLFVWYRDIIEDLTSLPDYILKRDTTNEEWIYNPAHALELYIEQFYEASKPKISEEK